jgi:hypothetical protein
MAGFIGVRWRVTGLVVVTPQWGRLALTYHVRGKNSRVTRKRQGIIVSVACTLRTSPDFSSYAYSNSHHTQQRVTTTSQSEAAVREPPSLNMSAPQQNEAEKNIEIWKVKKLIKRLETARGNGTSMISLIIRKLCPYRCLNTR